MRIQTIAAQWIDVYALSGIGRSTEIVIQNTSNEVVMVSRNESVPTSDVIVFLRWIEEF